MDVVLAFSKLWSRKLLVLAALLISVVAGVLIAYRVDLSPFSLTSRGIEYAIGDASLLVDAGDSPLSNATVPVAPLIQRAQIVTAALGGSATRSPIAQQAGVDVDDLVVASLGSGGTSDPGADQRASQIVDRGLPYQVYFRPTAGSPVITIATQAPTAPEARRLAGVAARVAQQYIEGRVLRSDSSSTRVVLRRVTSPSSSEVNPGGAAQAAIIIALVVFLVLLFLILLVVRVREDMATRRASQQAADVGEPVGAP